MKTLKYILIVAAAAFVLVGCNKKSPKLSGIDFEPMKIQYGYTTFVSAYPKPWDCTDYTFTYKSANPDIVSVDAYGTVTPEWVGNTSISVSSGAYSADVPVEVYTNVPESVWKNQIGDIIQAQVSDKLNGLWEFNGKAPMKATVGKDLVPHYPDSGGDLGPISDDGYTKVLGFHAFDGAILTKYNALFELSCNLSSGTCYTFLIDAMRPSSSDNKYTTFLSWEKTSNAADQYIDWRKDGCFQFGGGGDYRSGPEYFSNDKWWRMVFFMDLANGRQKVFANGQKILDVASPNGTGFFPYPDMVLLNADNDGDDAPLYFSTVAVWDRALTDEEVAILGEPVLYE